MYFYTCGNICVLVLIFPAIHAQEYVGCYTDKKDRAMPVSTTGSKVNVNWCINYCRVRQFGYAGLQYRDQCYCGNRYDKHGPAYNRTVCNRQCRTNRSQICGGVWALSIYRVVTNECEKETDRCNLTSTICIDTKDAYRCDCKPGLSRAQADGYWTCSGSRQNGTSERTNGFTAGLFAGIAVGAGVTLVAVIVIILLKRRRRRKSALDGHTITRPEGPLPTTQCVNMQEREQPEGEGTLEHQGDISQDNPYCLLTLGSNDYENHPDSRLYADMSEPTNLKNNETSY